MSNLRPPLFIIGNPRSGTTMFRLMLTCHPNIVIVPECGFSVWLYARYSDWRWDVKRFEEAFLPDLIACRKIETWKMDSVRLIESIKSQRPDRYTDLVTAVYGHYASEHKPCFSRWGDKTNFYVNHVGTVHEIFPEAIIIHIIRDGRDVACSYRELNLRQIDAKYAPRLPNAIDKIAQQWSANVTRVREASRSIPRDQFYEIRYEDLVGNAERSLNELCTFIDEPFDLAMLDFANMNRKSDLEPPEFLLWKERTTCALDPTRAGRFRAEWNAEQVSIFEEYGAEALTMYGYDIAAKGF